MSVAEFIEWQILESLEPFGDRRADIHAGIIAATIANVNRSAETPAFTPFQFIEHLWALDNPPERPTEPTVRRDMSDQELVAFMHMLVKTTNPKKGKPN